MGRTPTSCESLSWMAPKSSLVDWKAFRSRCWRASVRLARLGSVASCPVLLLLLPTGALPAVPVVLLLAVLGPVSTSGAAGWSQVGPSAPLVDCCTGGPTGVGCRVLAPANGEGAGNHMTAWLRGNDSVLSDPHSHQISTRALRGNGPARCIYWPQQHSGPARLLQPRRLTPL